MIRGLRGLAETELILSSSFVASTPDLVGRTPDFVASTESPMFPVVPDPIVSPLNDLRQPRNAEEKTLVPFAKSLRTWRIFDLDLVPLRTDLVSSQTDLLCQQFLHQFLVRYQRLLVSLQLIKLLFQAFHSHLQFFRF